MQHNHAPNAVTDVFTDVKAAICMVNDNPMIYYTYLSVLTQFLELPDGKIELEY